MATPDFGFYAVRRGRYTRRARCSVEWDLSGDIPDKTDQLPGDGDADLVQMQLPCAQTPIALAQPALGTPGNITHGRGLSLLTPLKRESNPCREAIVPGRFDQDTTGVTVAGLGDLTESACLAARVLRGHQSQIPHQLARMR